MEFFRVRENGITNVTILFVDENESPFYQYLVEGRWEAYLSYAIIGGDNFYFRYGRSVFRQLIAWCSREGNITNDTVGINFNIIRSGNYGSYRYSVSYVTSIDGSRGNTRSEIDSIKGTEPPISEVLTRLTMGRDYNGLPSIENVRPRKKRITYSGTGIKHKFV